MPTRREFFNPALAVGSRRSVTTGGSALGLGPAALEAGRPARALRILFLGGTGFIGPHMVRYAMYRGHKVSLFNRGQTARDLFPGAEAFVGDRDGKLDALKGGRWDAVVDNSGYVPRHVRDSADLLKGAVGRYLFISTGSVYKLDQEEIPEDGKLLDIEDPNSEDVNKYYGQLKVLAEQAVRERFGNRSTILRLHVVAGPGDPTDRFTFWPVRIDRGGDVIAPGNPADPVQFIDARDLAEFTIHCLENDIPGTFNTAGPALAETPMDQFLYGVRAVTTGPVAFHWMDSKFLAEQKVRYPLWIPQDGPARGLSKVRSNRAVAAGLRFRPLAVTARETLEWFKSEPAERQAKLNLQLERDEKALAAWKARGSR